MKTHSGNTQTRGSYPDPIGSSGFFYDNYARPHADNDTPSWLEENFRSTDTPGYVGLPTSTIAELTFEFEAYQQITDLCDSGKVISTAGPHLARAVGNFASGAFPTGLQTVGLGVTIQGK